jgi:hypothetical protein
MNSTPILSLFKKVVLFKLVYTEFALRHFQAVLLCLPQLTKRSRQSRKECGIYRTSPFKHFCFAKLQALSAKQSYQSFLKPRDLNQVDPN